MFGLKSRPDSQADKYCANMEFASIQIGKNTALDKDRERILSNLLVLRTGKHEKCDQVINEQEIEIIRLLHEQMDLKIRPNT